MYDFDLTPLIAMVFVVALVAGGAIVGAIWLLGVPWGLLTGVLLVGGLVSGWKWLMGK